MRKPSACYPKTSPTKVTLLFTLLLALNVMSALAAETVERGKLLVIGDSLSAAYGIDIDDGWVSLLGERLQSEGYPLDIVNSSVSGDTSANGLSRLSTLLDDYKPAIVIVELGGNDGLRGLSLKELKSNLSQIVEQSRAADAEVLVLGVQIPSNYGAGYTKLFANTFVQVAEEGSAALVPSFMTGMEKSPELFQEDGIHPSTEAQPLLLNNTWVELQPMLDRVFQ